MCDYHSFAQYYDGLMEDARYPERCRYFWNICRRFHRQPGRTLDLACGTGSLTLLLAQSGVDVFGADASPEMLSEAMNKALEAEQHILFVCQPMQALALPEPIDTCICTLDSLNHLTDEGDVQRTFDGVARYLTPGGLFIFDVNSVYKHREILADNAFVMENERVFCAWQNFLREDDIVDIALDFFAEEDGVYHRSSEDFSERAYSEESLRQMLQNAGLETLAVWGDLRFETPRDDEQRLIFVAQKMDKE